MLAHENRWIVDEILSSASGMVMRIAARTRSIAPIREGLPEMMLRRLGTERSSDRR